jgi:predicted small secreted protein
MKPQYIRRLQRLLPLALASTFIAIAAASAGCNTAHGFGKDMEKAGEKIQDGTR